MYSLGSGSKKHLLGGKPELVAVVERAIQISTVDFSVVDCLRTEEEQLQNISNGVSWTMDSRHLPDLDGKAFAVDLYPWVDNETNHSEQYYSKIARAMFQAAIELNVIIEWGGFWGKPDRPHWQLSRKKYPKATAGG